MKKITPWFALFTILLLLTSCHDESPAREINESPAAEIKAVLSTDGLDIVVGDGDFEKTITVTLSHNAPSDAVFAVTIVSEGEGDEAVDKNITIPKGEKTGTGKIRFLKKAYPFEDITGKATVSISTATPVISTVEAGSLVFNIRGTGPITGTVAQFDCFDNSVKVPIMGNAQYNFVINLSESTDKDILFHITAECDVADGYFGLSETVTIIKGQTQGSGNISFSSNMYPYDTNKANVTLTIRSEDVFVLPSGSKMHLKVSGSSINQ